MNLALLMPTYCLQYNSIIIFTNTNDNIMEEQSMKMRLFNNLKLHLGRLAPYVITEIHKTENDSLFQKTLPLLEPYITLEQIESPKFLFDFIKQHQNDLIIVTADIFSMRKNYIDVIEGAVCSSPDSMALWPVRYQNKEFTFKGKLILCTMKTKQEIKSDSKLMYFARDCYFI